MRVLVLEDDPDMREALAETLRDEGYEVHTASRGSEAVALAGQHSFELIVSDIRMEGMSGLDVIEAVQQQQPGMGSMVVSGWASEAETLRAVQLNVGAYLKKPFGMDDFLEAVKTTAKRRAPAAGVDWTDWSLDLLTATLDQAALLAPRGSLSRARRLAQSWARELGYETGQLSAAGKLALFWALQDLPGFHAPSGPEWLRGWPGTEEPLQWLARASWEASRAAVEGELPPSARLLEAMGPPSGPEIWAAYEQAGKRWDHAQAPLPPLSRGLLSLGQTLLESGDHVSARQAFLQVLQGPDAPLFQQAQASLWLARLDWDQGQVKAAVEWAQQSFGLAARLGALTAASLALEAALIRHRAGAGEARAQLEQVAGWAARLGLKGHQAVCALVLAAAGLASARDWLPQAWETLEDEAYWQEARLAARWLMPELLTLGAEAVPFCLQHPQALASYVRAHPEAEARVRELLQDHSVPPGLLQALGAPAGGALPLEPAVQQLRLTCFGPFEVFRGDNKVPEAAWKTQKNKLLLAFLLSQTGQAIHEEHVLEEFWPDDVVRGKRNLYSALSLIRRALRPESEGEETVLRLQDRLSFNWALPHWYDVEVFEKAAQRGLAAQAGDDAVFHLRRAAQLYRAPYLEGCFADWALRRRDELEQQAQQVFVRLCQLLCQRRMYSEALEQAQRLLQWAPHLQDAHLYKMRAHLGLGQPEAVLKQFSACERMLRQEYGIEPNTELLEVVLRARHGLPDVAEIA